MSGLFATLVAAAQGEAPALLHRPRPRFAEDAFTVPPEGLAVEEVEAQAQPQPSEPTLPRAGRPLMANAVGQAGDAPLLRAPPRPDRFDESAGQTGAPAIPEAPAAKAESFHSLLPHTPVQSPPVASKASAAHPLSPAVAADATNLLPANRDTSSPMVGQEVQFANPMPGSAAKQERAEAGTSGFELRIGRIEVTAAQNRATAPVQTAAPQSRPVMVPRARPRQSLDDYLRGRKR